MLEKNFCTAGMATGTSYSTSTLIHSPRCRGPLSIFTTSLSESSPGAARAAAPSIKAWLEVSTPFLAPSLAAAVTAIWARMISTAWAKSRKTSNSSGRTRANSAVACPRREVIIRCLEEHGKRANTLLHLLEPSQRRELRL